MRKTVTEIVELIVSSYNSNTRSMDSEKPTRCMYNASSGRHCAFAIMVKDTTIFTSTLEGLGARQILNRLGTGILKDEFNGHNIEFYQDVQHLHDNYRYWDDEGITKSGREYADRIITTYETPADVSV